jgi:ribosomal protein S18 acetylase RimI-like enzyme
MQVHEVNTLLAGRRAELNSIVIDHASRGKGFGRQMMIVAENWVRDRGLPKVRLGSRTSRTEAHQFYTKHGFSIEKEWFIFSKSVF